jgi:hypothetical protein
VLTVIAVVMGLIGVPVLLVWPAPWAHLVPRRFRRFLASRPVAGAFAVAGPPTLFICGAWTWLIVRASTRATNFGSVTLIVLLVSAIFGGLTAAASVRAVRVWVIGWTLRDPELAAPAGGSTEPAPVGDTRPATELARPARHQGDRVLRNASTWLISVGTGWYFLGRTIQAGSGNVSAPDWWWLVTLGLVTAGAVVWVGRRVRWHGHGRSNAPYGSWLALSGVARAYDLEVHRPAGEWVRRWTPQLFKPRQMRMPAAVWPWAATGDIDGGKILVAAQFFRAAGREGITKFRVRTCCILRVEGAQLPHVVISEREAVRPTARNNSLAFEHEAFNRSFWVSGPNARGVYDIVHPRQMLLMLQQLPDGVQLHTGGHLVAAVTDEPVSVEHLLDMVSVVRETARMLPSYLAPSAGYVQAARASQVRERM